MKFDTKLILNIFGFRFEIYQQLCNNFYKYYLSTL